MLRKKNVTSAVLAVSMALPLPSVAQTEAQRPPQKPARSQTLAQTDRPPQFVMFAFDGSYTLDVWQYSRNFTQNQKANGIDTRFTFFINPVYLLTRQTSGYYNAPGGRRGSAIGWGDSVSDVSQRIDQMNEAHREGHEIASHAIGHWDGSNWSQSDWDSEFRQFDHIMENLFSINGIRTTNRGYNSLLFKKDDIVGFRAPQLGVSKGLWPTLSKFKFKYDTSKTSNENYWPQKESSGLWNFPLARIQEPNGARTWLSMDYNFCVRDSSRILSEEKGAMSLTAVDPKSGKTLKNNDRSCLRVISPQQKRKVKDNMLALYRSYFNKNYYGNRAPVHIGHHFSPWMSGAYLEAFYEFANEVCHKPEVRCGVYKDLLSYMESHSGSQIQSYQAGNFTKMPRPKNLQEGRHWDLRISTTLDQQQDKLVASLVGKDAERKGLVLKVSNLDKALGADGSISLQDLRGVGTTGEDLILRLAVYDRRGQEVATSSYLIKSLGTQNETFEAQNIEEKWLAGHMNEAHAEDNAEDSVDFTRGH